MSSSLLSVAQPSTITSDATDSPRAGNSLIDGDNELLIAIMGPTGSGKSSFINLVSGSDGAVGHTLKSCTREVEPTDVFELGGHRVRLIDTPGFDDSRVSDADILQKIADFMDVSYRSGRKLNGLLYFHRIIDNRVGGVSYMNMQMFQKLCGDGALKNVFLCTTMWDLVPPEVGEERERELKEDFWASMIEQGASVVRHDGSAGAARNVVSRMLHLNPVTLRIQEELVDEQKTLMETLAGARISEVLRNLESKYRELLKRASDDYQKAIEEKNRVMEALIEKQRKEYQAKLDKANKDNETLLRVRDTTITSLASRLESLETRGRAYWWLFFNSPRSPPSALAGQATASSSAAPSVSAPRGSTAQLSTASKPVEKRAARPDQWNCAIM
ncbi:hypothetical protein BOTBODRAFT_127680 [Botryobasidium botryosum FD-172 SS1]|uniref:G domain-containing protein n=1 Tax=Botryobasidium botryosum (strain FD-172 SS1) TaxID=930990 RepID=A0A067N4P8_BOTB1|nr:hypothetical protein BOTBODRAFT_127680 [Botryobasidium botryosum FD-172 SS1]